MSDNVLQASSLEKHLDSADEKKLYADVDVLAAEDDPRAKVVGDEEADANLMQEMNVTAEELAALEKRVSALSLGRTFHLVRHIYNMHKHDPNFVSEVLYKMKDFLDLEETIVANPEHYEGLVNEMKLEALLVTENSPYSQVRAVVSLDDDPDMPSLTFRTWVLSTVLVGIQCAVNALFDSRTVSISLGGITMQIVAYPCGKFLARVLPDWGITFRGVRHSINPGPFNRKEHMLITVATACASGAPYTNNLIISQSLPQFFDQAYARDFGYQIVLGLAMNYGGYGLAGLARRFLVYPAYCVWPSQLVVIALNNAFHNKGTDRDAPVPGPGRKIYSLSQFKLFNIAFVAMFIYFWFPNFIFTALSYFNWINWIAPNNVKLSIITGYNNGLAVNPWPSFDWNMITYRGDPLVLPAFTIFNNLIGMAITGLIIVAVYFTNTWNTAYLPIIGNRVYANNGKTFSVTKIIDERAMFDAAKYQKYSQPYMTAANVLNYIWFVALYTGVLTYSILFHGYELMYGLKGFAKIFRKKTTSAEGEANTEELEEDIHTRLMKKYPEVPEWWYLILLLGAMGMGMAGVGGWETYTTPAVVIFGYALSAFFLLPVGIVSAVTGTEVTLNVLAELVGGAVAPGNALTMNFFKSFGVDTLLQALGFTENLKLAHYVKISQRHTFVIQLWCNLISTFIFVGMLNFKMTSIPGFCTEEAKWQLTCPGINTFFTASVFWGTIGARRMFGPGGLYPWIMAGFPIGVILPLLYWLVTKKFPRSNIVRQFHPILFLSSGVGWNPYGIGWGIGAVPFSCISWLWLKKRHLAFWAKYNFVLAAAFSGAIAISGFIQFWAVQYSELELDWWGNSVSNEGCELPGHACTLLTKADYPGGKPYFGPDPGTFLV